MSAVLQIVTAMAVALTDARVVITADRQSLFDSTVQADGTVADDDKAPLDEYDRVLDQINTALDQATGAAS